MQREQVSRQVELATPFLRHQAIRQDVPATRVYRRALHQDVPATQAYPQANRLAGQAIQAWRPATHQDVPATQAYRRALHQDVPATQAYPQANRLAGQAIQAWRPAIHRDVPAIQAPRPAIHRDVPATQAPRPAIHRDVPATQAPRPAIHQDVPATQAYRRALHRDVPATQAYRRALHQDVPATQALRPAIHQGGPASQVARQVLRRGEPAAQAGHQTLRPAIHLGGPANQALYQAILPGEAHRQVNHLGAWALLRLRTHRHQKNHRVATQTQGVRANQTLRPAIHLGGPANQALRPAIHLGAAHLLLADHPDDSAIRQDATHRAYQAILLDVRAIQAGRQTFHQVDRATMAHPLVRPVWSLLGRHPAILPGEVARQDHQTVSETNLQIRPLRVPHQRATENEYPPGIHHLHLAARRKAADQSCQASDQAFRLDQALPHERWAARFSPDRAHLDLDLAHRQKAAEIEALPENPRLGHLLADPARYQAPQASEVIAGRQQIALIENLPAASCQTDSGATA